MWYAPLKGVGTTAYPVYGFIYGGKAQAEPTGTAQRSIEDDQPLVMKAIDLLTSAG